jgi:chromosome segregation ATPase
MAVGAKAGVFRLIHGAYPSLLERRLAQAYQTSGAWLLLGWATTMGKIVGTCVVLFLLAAGFLIVAAAPDLAALFAALRSAPWPEKLAWAIVVLVPPVLLPAAVWLYDLLRRQRTVVDALELRLDGVRQDVKALAAAQIDADMAMHYLARSDPENAIGAMTQRLSEADRILGVQEKRSDIGALSSRVDALRIRQQELLGRLGPALENRRAVERLFLELDTSQNDIARGLAEITSGDDATALDLRLKDLTEFVGSSRARCDDIDAALKALTSLNGDFAALQRRLAPFAAVNDGVISRLKELGDLRARLAGDIDALQGAPEGTLAERVASFTADTERLDDDVSELGTQFGKLKTLRADIDDLMAKLAGTLDIVVAGANGSASNGIDARIDELSAFVDAMLDDLDKVEDTAAAFSQLKTRLGELQSRLAPLEAQDSGIVSVIGQVQNIRDQLAARIERLEEGDDGDLAARVKTFTDARRELEQRVSAVTEHFSALATMRKDLAGLFDKLNNAAAAPSN